MKAKVLDMPPPQKTAARDPNEPAPVPGKFLVTLKRPDGKVTYMHVDNEHFERVSALWGADPSIQKILPPVQKSESDDNGSVTSPIDSRERQ